MNSNFTLGEKTIYIPADIPLPAVESYVQNYKAITRNTGNLMLFACDQKIEHLNEDFSGPNVHPDAQNPKHIFEIASEGTIGALATHVGLISRYAKEYPTINFIAKLNGKTNIIPTEDKDPLSKQLWSVDDVVSLKNQSGINICGVGYTVYLGSEFESTMLQEAAQLVFNAHQNGLVTILWMYARGAHIEDETDPELMAGAAGIATSLGSDFVKIKPPRIENLEKNAELLKTAVSAAGNTKVICSGGKTIPPKEFFTNLYNQIHNGYTSGNATGRNIFQRSKSDAIAFTKAISAIVLENKSVEDAIKIYQQQ